MAGYAKKVYFSTGIEGLDKMFNPGIPKGSCVIISGCPGAGKTLMALNIVKNACVNGKRCLYLSLEESEERIRDYMEGFGWKTDYFLRKGLLRIRPLGVSDVEKITDCILKEHTKKEIRDSLLPHGFSPDVVVIDSLSTISSCIHQRGFNYRVYAQRLFKVLDEIGGTNFMITQNANDMGRYEIDEFLADGIINLYYLKNGSNRERAIEVLKMRGVGHQQSTVAFGIEKDGIKVFPEQDVFA